MYLSQSSRDYNAIQGSETFIHTTFDAAFLILGQEPKLYKIDVSGDNLKRNNRQEYDQSIRPATSLITTEVFNPISTFFTNNHVYWFTPDTPNIIKKHSIKTTKTTQIILKQDLNISPGSRNLISYKEGFIALEQTGRFIMIDATGTITWSFLNNQMLRVERFDGTDYYTQAYGSNTFNRGFFQYKGYLYVSSNVAGRVIRIKIGGGTDDWQYLGAKSATFSISHNKLCTINAMEGSSLSSYHLSEEGITRCTTRTDLRAHAMFSLGNELLAVINTQDNPGQLVLIDSVTLDYKVLANDLPTECYSIKDISVSQTHVFIFTGNLYKIPKHIFQEGGFDLRDYCYYDHHTSLLSSDSQTDAEYPQQL